MDYNRNNYSSSQNDKNAIHLKYQIEKAGKPLKDARK